MKDNELRFDRTCHVLYTKQCKREIQEKIALHYPVEQRGAVWERVQLQYVDYLKDWRTDLGGKKNFHNGAGGTYDCIALMAYYTVCREATSLAEIEEMEGNLFLPAFRRLQFADANKPLIYNLDFPDVIAVRDKLLPAGEREENIPCDLNDTEWFGRIDASGGAVFFAAGVFYYFLSGQVRTLVQAMEKAFPGGRLVFDAANKTAVKMMLKTWIKDAQIKDVGAYFAVSDAVKELGAWSPDMRVSSRGYMLGYQSLDCASVNGAYRFLAKVGDGLMTMQIVRLDFGGGRTGGV